MTSSTQSNRTISKQRIGLALMALAALLLIGLQYYAHSSTYAAVDTIEVTGVITDAQRSTVNFANILKPVSALISGIMFATGLIILVRARGNTSLR